jgi:uncharacterized protein (TIGR02594 family)
LEKRPVTGLLRALPRKKRVRCRVLSIDHLAAMIAGEPIWIAEARKHIGLREKSGSRSEPGVVEFFADSGNAWVRDDETAWCGAFVSAMFVRTGPLTVRPPGNAANALRARRWLDVGQGTDRPRVGDIAVFWRGSPDGAQGHVGFYMGEDGDSVLVLGGNQSNQVSIARYGKDRLLGFRRPVAGAEIDGLDDALRRSGSDGAVSFAISLAAGAGALGLGAILWDAAAWLGVAAVVAGAVMLLVRHRVKLRARTRDFVHYGNAATAAKDQSFTEAGTEPTNGHEEGPAEALPPGGAHAPGRAQTD